MPNTWREWSSSARKMTADQPFIPVGEKRRPCMVSFGPLMDAVGDARFVLLGEASHGTHEFYRRRAAITQRLVEEKGFSAVVVTAGAPALRPRGGEVRSAGCTDADGCKVNASAGQN